MQFLSQAPFSGRSGLLGSFTFLRCGPIPTQKWRPLRFVALSMSAAIFDDDAAHRSSGAAAAILQRKYAVTLCQRRPRLTTQVLLVNQTENVLDGKITFLDRRSTCHRRQRASDKVPASYRVAAKSAFRLRTPDTADASVGLFDLRLRSSADLPVGFLVFSYRAGGVTVSSTGVPSVRTCKRGAPVCGSCRAAPFRCRPVSRLRMFRMRPCASHSM